MLCYVTRTTDIGVLVAIVLTIIVTVAKPFFIDTAVTRRARHVARSTPRHSIDVSSCSTNNRFVTNRITLII